MSPDDTLVRDVILRDGTTLWLRPPTGADEAAVLAFFARLSPVSVYRRFHGVPRITPRLIAPFLDPDWYETGALVGTLAGEGPGHAYARQIVAVASYVRLRAASSVEAAFAVAEVLPDNRAMIDVSPMPASAASRPQMRTRSPTCSCGSRASPPTCLS